MTICAMYKQKSGVAVHVGKNWTLRKNIEPLACARTFCRPIVTGMRWDLRSPCLLPGGARIHAILSRLCRSSATRFPGARQDEMNSVQPRIALVLRKSLETFLNNLGELLNHTGNLIFSPFFLRHHLVPALLRASNPCYRHSTLLMDGMAIALLRHVFKLGAIATMATCFH